MSDQLDIETAMKLARSLTTMDGFPRFEDAITATATDLMEWCEGAILDGRRWSAASQANWLVQEARLTWRKWSGTGDFFALFRSKFPRKLPAGNTNDFHEPGLKPPIACRKCSDRGTVKLSTGRYDWCDCEQAGYLRRDWPDFLELANKHLAPKPRLVRTKDVPLTAAQIDAMRAEERRLVEQAIDGAETMLHDPRATKEQKKAARKLLKLYRPKREAAS